MSHLPPAPVFRCRGCDRPTLRWRASGRGVRLTCITCTPSVPLNDRLENARRAANVPAEVAAQRADVSLCVLMLAERRPVMLQEEELHALAGLYGVEPERFGAKGGAP
jgi:hypothetical protein